MYTVYEYTHTGTWGFISGEILYYKEPVDHLRHNILVSPIFLYSFTGFDNIACLSYGNIKKKLKIIVELSI